jgi:hypothetical protein
MIRAQAGLKLYKREKGTDKEAEIPSSYADGLYQIEFKPDLNTFWLLLS